MRRACAAALLAAGRWPAARPPRRFRAGEKAERRAGLRPRGARVLQGRSSRPRQPRLPAGPGARRLRASAGARRRRRRRLVGRGLYKEALDELRLALDLNPELRRRCAARSARRRARRQAAASRPTLVPRSRTGRASAPCPASSSGPGRREPLGLSFRNASLREAYQALGKRRRG